jgi:hypothetical protein
MTRRKFVRKLAGAGLTIVAGASWFLKKAAPRKIIWAVRIKKYPGSVRPLGDISKQGKWSG